MIHRIALRRWLWGVAAVSALGLSGCGGGTGSPSTVSGVVADGYLKGAVVFLDKNGNKTWDEGEPKATTGDGGVYTLTAVSSADVASYPIVVEVPVGAVDEERGAVEKPYVLSAPAGKPEFVSPITTLVQSQIETNPTMTAEQAENVVKTNLGITSTSVSLFDNFVQKKGASEEYARIQKVAEVVATAVGNNIEAIRVAAPSADLNAIIKVIVQEVVAQLPTITKEVETNSTFNATTIAAAAVPTTRLTSDATQLQQQIAQASTTATVSSFQDALAGEGFYWMEIFKEYDNSFYEYGVVKLGAQQNGSYALTESFFTYTGGSWVESTEESDDYTLTSAGWVLEDDSAAAGTLKFNTDGTATWTLTKSGRSEIIRVAKIDVAGKLVAPFVEPEGISVTPGTTFGPGAAVYKMTFTANQDEYSIWSGSTYSSPWAAASIDELIGIASSQERGIYVGRYLRAALAGTGTTGVLDFYQGPTKLQQSGSWTKKTIGSENVLILSIPVSMRLEAYGLDWLEPGEDMIFGVINGQLKQGEVRYANMPRTERGYNFSKTAMDTILQNFVPGNLTQAPKRLTKR
ncbi:hypothetical protein [Geobacter sp. DSM 9736]|uniref:hypothetical protein n=1 Tax=Geobacter sp. DSM 9736 TaxID=1277350 RepID=UPI000B60A0A2|nr:hypothetical protein [Geobacter sp. DSM 9736]SNB46148.1 hypothetical protein SAMN06269301_1592 [Geobacter sp. DSM 9736]